MQNGHAAAPGHGSLRRNAFSSPSLFALGGAGGLQSKWNVTAISSAALLVGVVLVSWYMEHAHSVVHKGEVFMTGGAAWADRGDGGPAGPGGAPAGAGTGSGPGGGGVPPLLGNYTEGLGAHANISLHGKAVKGHAYNTTREENTEKIARYCEAGSDDPICMNPDAIRLDLTNHWSGFLSVLVFGVAYATALLEEYMGHHFRKSIPTTIAAGIIWSIICFAYESKAPHELPTVAATLRHNLMEFSETFLFLLVAMTYVITLEDMNVFECVRIYLLGRGFSLKQMFWVTGALSFVLSPIADNLTTAMLMGAVAKSIGQGNSNYIVLSYINIVVASNAGGAFSPFGDITTLMVWQKGKLQFLDFLRLVAPSLVNWLVPAVLMSAALPAGTPKRTDEAKALHEGAGSVIGLFLMTITFTAVSHSVAHMPPVIGMMTGLGCLQLFGYMEGQKREPLARPPSKDRLDAPAGDARDARSFDIFDRLAEVEWDTLLFFYGVIMCVGGLGLLGYLDAVAGYAYQELGPTTANVLVGLLSGIVDNIPVMYAVLQTDPPMPYSDWLLVTLTAGVGGSIFSIGSAAGVGLMGQARGVYGFSQHLKWSWAILLGYTCSVLTHFAVNGVD